jgi:hypothetical protein
MDVFDFYLSTVDKYRELPFQNTTRKRAIVLEVINKLGRKLPDIETHENFETLIKPIVAKYVPKTKREFVADFLLENNDDIVRKLIRDRTLISQDFYTDLDLLCVGADINQDSLKYEKMIDYLGLEIISDFWINKTISQLCNEDEFNLKELYFRAIYMEDDKKIDDSETRSINQINAFEGEKSSLVREIYSLKAAKKRALTKANLTLAILILIDIVFYLQLVTGFDSNVTSILMILLCFIPLFLVIFVFGWQT